MLEDRLEIIAEGISMLGDVPCNPDTDVARLCGREDIRAEDVVAVNCGVVVRLAAALTLEVVVLGLILGMRVSPELLVEPRWVSGFGLSSKGVSGLCWLAPIVVSGCETDWMLEPVTIVRPSGDMWMLSASLTSLRRIRLFR